MRLAVHGACLLLLTLAAGCSSAHTSEIRDLQCEIEAASACGAPACRAAISERDDCIPESEALSALERPELRACVRGCPPVGACRGGLFPAPIVPECNCTADCVGRESDDYQRAYLDLLVCITPDECRGD